MPDAPLVAVHAATRLHRNIEDDGFLEDSLESIERLYRDWKHFAIRKNVVEVATGLMVANALTEVSKSIMTDFMTPLIQWIWGGANLGESFIVLKGGMTNETSYATVEAAQADGALTLNYGRLIDSILNFVFLTFCTFLMYRTFKWLSKLVSKEMSQMARAAGEAATNADRALERGNVVHEVSGRL